MGVCGGHGGLSAHGWCVWFQVLMVVPWFQVDQVLLVVQAPQVLLVMAFCAVGSQLYSHSVGLRAVFRCEAEVLVHRAEEHLADLHPIARRTGGQQRLQLADGWSERNSVWGNARQTVDGKVANEHHNEGESVRATQQKHERAGDVTLH
jgi:hypothetical protein